MMGRSPWRCFDFIRYLSLPTYERANATYAGFDYQKNHHDGENVHDVPPLFDFPAIDRTAENMPYAGQEGEPAELHGIYLLTQ